MFSTRSSDIPYVCITVAFFGEIKSLFQTIQGRERYAWTACFVRLFLCCVCVWVVSVLAREFVCVCVWVVCALAIECDCVCVSCVCPRERVGLCLGGVVSVLARELGCVCSAREL